MTNSIPQAYFFSLLAVPATTQLNDASPATTANAIAIVRATQPQTTSSSTTATTVSYSPSDVANLPLLLPFACTRPSESIVVRAIMNEQHAADALANVVSRKETLQTELQRVKSSGDQQENQDLRGRRRNVPSSSSLSGGALVVARRNPKSKQTSSKKAATTARVREIESQIDAATHAIAQCQTRLADSANWTRTMLQSEYSKRAVLLESDSRSYSELEEAFNFLSARVASYVLSSEVHFDEQRLAYVNEMLPVMRRVGERDTRESLSAFPYIQKFQADPPMIDAMIDEMHQLLITEGLRSRLEKRMGSDPAKFKVLKHAEEMLDRREVETDELVRKHYRRRSVKLHPDRNGERMRPVFEEFTDARNVLSDVRLRRDYLGHMLDMYKYYGTSQLPQQTVFNMMAESHDSWNKRNRPDKANNIDGGADGGGKKDKPLTLEGGLHQQMPRGVMLHQRRENRTTLVSVSIHALRPIHDFYARVRSVRVKFRSTSDETHTFVLSRSDIVKTIQVDRRGPILANEIPIVETALNPGNWEVFWYAELDTAGTDLLNPHISTENEVVVTRPSAKVSFEVVDHSHQELLQGFDRAENCCKVIKAELSNILHKLRTNQTDLPMRTPQRYGYYHNVLVRARKKHSCLYGLMLKTGRQSSVYNDLTKLLSECRQVFADLEKVVDTAKKRQEKKDDVKRFKSYIARILEADDPAAWMKDVTSEELLCEGGDVNRLYQLFTESKRRQTPKADLLVFDSEMYEEASLREDLFSAKQRKDLSAKGNEVAALDAKEEEEVAAAEEKRKSEEEEREKLRKEADSCDKWAMVGHNATIHGLTSKKGKTLNNQPARIIFFVVEKDRFEVELYNSDEKILLKKENLNLYYGHVPNAKRDRKFVEEVRQPSFSSSSSDKISSLTIWNCDCCTFENDVSRAACSMCTTPKLQKPKQEEPSVGNKVDGEVHAALPHEQKLDTSVAPNVLEHEHDSARVKKTIFIRSSLSKKITGKRGRKKKELINKSGVADIHIETSSIGNQVPVHLIGSTEANLKAIALIHETVGVDNVSENFDTLPSALTTPLPASTSADSLPLEVAAPTSPVPAPDEPGPLENNSLAPVNSYQTDINFSNSCIFSAFSNSFMNGIHHVSVSGSEETEPTSQFSFDDALLPRGLMDISVTTPATSLPLEVPSEIGIRSQGFMIRDTITVTDDGERSSTSKTSSSFTLNENDPLLVFLRSQHLCVKGSVDEFYTWLVKSEDIDSIAALKEAVSDDEYLENSMKIGCGTSGLKGFKRRAFQRATLEYHEEQAGILSTKHNDSSPLRGFDNPLVPANLAANFFF